MAGSFFGYAINPVDTGSLSNEMVTITPPGSMLKGDLVFALPVCRTDSGASWSISNSGGQQWFGIGGPLAGFGLTSQRYWCEFNGTWLNNQLTANQASFETDTTGWTAETNCSISRESDSGFNGSFACRMNSSAAGTMTMITPTGTSGFPVTWGKTYKAMCHIRTLVSGRTVTIGIFWYDGAGNELFSHTGGFITDTTSFQRISVTASPPSGAAYAAVRISVQSTGAANEQHHVDGVSFAVDSGSGDWYMPSSINPIFDSNFGSALTISGLMLVFRPGLDGRYWIVDAQTGGFLDGGTFPHDLIIPSQTVKENSELCIGHWMRDFQHDMTLQTGGWTNPGGVDEWTNVVTPGSLEILISAAYKFQNKGTSGDVANRANGASFQQYYYTSFYEVPRRPSQVKKERRVVRASRW